MTAANAKLFLQTALQFQVEERGREFIMNDNISEILDRLSRVLTEGSYHFGLHFYGGCGNGKTTFVKAFQTVINRLQLKIEEECYGNWAIRIMDARAIADLAKNDNDEWQQLCRIPMLAIDDLGTEPVEVLDYGNVLYPIVDLLTRRYDRQLFTVITTNLTSEEIRAKYGERIADRLNEMMTKIVFRDSSFRRP